jgi:hypothetical protein
LKDTKKNIELIISCGKYTDRNIPAGEHRDAESDLDVERAF